MSRKKPNSKKRVKRYAELESESGELPGDPLDGGEPIKSQRPRKGRKPTAQRSLDSRSNQLPGLRAARR